MRELSLHILDIVENGVDAGAGLIKISVLEAKGRNVLTILIEDDGHGIENGLLKKVMDPFYTTRNTRRVGLGLSLFREASRRCAGDFILTSRKGKGTRVEATFRRDHIDLPPMGDIAGCISGMIMGHPEVDVTYIHRINGKEFRFDTREIKKELEDIAINEPRVVKYLHGLIRESEAELELGA